MEDRTTFCITDWDAVLKVNKIYEPNRKFKFGFVSVSDPNANDAGMYVSTNEIKALIHTRKK